jgi:hypothetical protein
MSTYQLLKKNSGQQLDVFSASQKNFVSLFSVEEGRKLLPNAGNIAHCHIKKGSSVKA